MSGSILEQAVEVQRSRLVSQLVRDVNDDVVTNVGGDRRQRPLSVYTNGAPVERTIRVGGHPGHVEIVANSGGSDASEERGCTDGEGSGAHGGHCVCKAS